MPEQAAEGTIEIALYATQMSKQSKRVQLTWDALCRKLSDVELTDCSPCDLPKSCPEKAGSSWSPVTIEGNRSAANVRSVNVLVLDLDHVAKVADLRQILSRLSPYRYVMHATHSSRPNDGAYRAVVALSRPVLASEWPAFYAAAVRRIGVQADPHCGDLARLYYLPRIARVHEKLFKVFDGEGDVLDVDTVLAESAQEPAAAPPPEDDDAPESTLPPVVLDVETVVDAIKDLRRKASRRHDQASVKIYDAALEGRELVPPGHGQEPALHQLMRTLSHKLPAGTAPECVVPVIDRSIVAMGAGPEGLDFWRQKAAASFRKGMNARVEKDRKEAEQVAAVSGSLRALLTPPRLREPSQQAEASPEATPADDESWRRMLIWEGVLPDGTARLKSCEANVTTILGHAPEWRGCLRMNDVTKELELSPENPIGRFVRPGVLARAVADYMQRTYRIFVGEAAVHSSLTLVARDNTYDPLTEQLTRFAAAWDRTPRIDDFYMRAARAVTTDVDGTSIEEHVRRISRMWFIGAAVRALSPGEKVDTVLVLEGAQGAKKTTLFAILGGAFYAAAYGKLDDQNGMMLAGCSWIVELAELASFRKSEVDTQKAFLSSTRDKFRLPYARVIEEFPRRAVFVGTVNPEDHDGAGYLTDRTGNRRYWPLRVGQIDTAYVRANRAQLWGEAATLAMEALAFIREHGVESLPAHLRWWLVPEEEHVASREAEARMQQHPYLDPIRDWILAIAPDKRPAFLRSADVAREALGMPAERFVKGPQIAVSSVLKDLGCVREKRRGVDGSPQWVYALPEALRTAPASPRTKHAPQLAVVLGGKP